MREWIAASSEYFTWIAAVTGGVIAIWQAGKGLLKITKTMDQVLTNSEYIHRELKPNGGGSLRDAVNRIDQRVDKIDERQQRAELRLAALNMSAPHAIFETNLEGKCVWVNRTFCRWSGRTVAEFMGSGWLNTVHPRHRARVEQAWDSAVEDGNELEMFFCIQDIYGDTMPVHMVAHPLRDQSGKVHGRVASITQVTCTNSNCNNCNFGSTEQSCSTANRR